MGNKRIHKSDVFAKKLKTEANIDTPKVKRREGAPTSYKPEYCEQVVNHMKEGLSFETFSAVIGVNPDTVYSWVKRHVEFAESKKVGEQLSYLFWEKVVRAAATGSIQNCAQSVLIFTMKNKFKWKDKQDIEHTGKDGKELDLAPKVILYLPNNDPKVE